MQNTGLFQKKEYISQNPFHSCCRVDKTRLVQHKFFTVKEKSLRSPALHFLEHRLFQVLNWAPNVREDLDAA